MDSLNLPFCIWQFSSELYDHIKSSIARDHNILLSPLSIHLAIALTLMGAAGTMAREIANGLGLNEMDNALIAKEYRKLTSSLDPNFNLENKWFVMKDCAILLAFRDTATRQFMSEIEEIDFADSASAAETINTWIKHKTNRRLKECVAPSDFNASTTLVLVNTVELNGFWMKQFSNLATSRKPFFHSKHASSEVDTKK